MIPFWSDTNPKVKEILLPTEETKWSELSYEDKGNMWIYMLRYFFYPELDYTQSRFNDISCGYKFYGKDIWENDRLAQMIADTMLLLNDKYKRKSYALNFLKKNTYDNACHDFYDIFMEKDMNVVFEMVTIYARIMVLSDSERIWKKDEESKENFEKRKGQEQWNRFDAFSERLSEVFIDFGVNYKLTRAGFIVSDEPVVIEMIYEPALKKLTSQKWVDINRDLRDAFSALNDDKDGSGAITHTLSALQGFLQVLVNGETGKGDTAALIKEGVSKKIIPDDDFSKKIIKEMNSFWARERQEKGDPHPKKEYATKEQAKLVLSLVMVFIDHVL